MPETLDQPDDFLQRLRAARQRCASGAGPVLDHLLAGGLGLEELDRQLRHQAGVAAVGPGSVADMDWQFLPPDGAAALQCLPLRLPGERHLRLGMADPWDPDRVGELTRALGQLPELAAISSDWVARIRPVDALAHTPPEPGSDFAVDPAADDAVTAFVDAAIRQALDRGASDVHFESDRQGITCKLRQDGVMVHWGRLEGIARAEEVVSRIKVLAQLDITERRTPQDGRCRWTQGGRSVDLRVSIMPSIHAEDAVLRLLDKAQLRSRGAAISLDLLGFEADQSARIRELAELPHGLLLVTGPTGSGKTTTLYAVLSEINTGLQKIVTIEDPVEYELPGVLQIPVNERKGLTFAKGLRSILRHDPDRILVGEIRDAETAEIAVQSALTGHQVFTTVHANSIQDVTSRFRHFGLDMFGLMAALNGVVVQRLLRRLCPHCAGRREPTERERPWLARWQLPIDSVPQAVGCPQCRGTGYRGRGVIAEVHLVDDGWRDLVTAQAPVSELRRHIDAAGVASLAQQGARLVAQGITTTDEVRRVVGWH